MFLERPGDSMCVRVYRDSGRGLGNAANPCGNAASSREEDAANRHEVVEERLQPRLAIHRVRHLWVVVSSEFTEFTIGDRFRGFLMPRRPLEKWTFDQRVLQRMPWGADLCTRFSELESKVL